MKQIDKLFDSIKDISKEKTKAYDTQATVTRVDGGTVYVHIPGGVDETPIDKTVSAKPGDVVQVRVANGKAWATGNATAPPTDDSAALRAEAEAAKANQAASSATQSAKVASESAADAQQKATTASTAAATALTKAEEAEDSAEQAATAAATADQKATAAGTAAAAAQTSADAASAAATRAETKADTASAAASRAETAAGNAETSAANAQSSADSALVGLSTVQDVVGVLNWITAHGTMTSQSGGTFDSNQVYFVQDNNGDYTVGGVRYSLVAEPKAADINSYYVLSVDESVQNYVATHIAVDSEGLWIIPDAGGNKVLIATGNGSSYTTAGTYIIGKVNNVDKVLAKFITTGATVGQADGAHSVIDADGQRFYASDGTTQLANIGYGEGASGSGTAVAPYYTFGKRISGSVVGNFSVAEGSSVTASGEESHAEGSGTSATAHGAHAEGTGTTASSFDAHAEGYYTVAGAGGKTHAEGDHTTASEFGAHAEGGQTVASGRLSHAQNNSTIAAKDCQTAIGKFNIEDTETTTAKQKAFIIGNGTSYTRSNAFTVDWSGNTKAAGDITDGSGNKLSDRASTTKYGMTQLVNSYSSTATDKAATPNAVKQAYDLANRHKDYITEQGTSGEWTYRKWNSGKTEAWCEHAFGSQTGTVWTSFLRFKDLKLTIPTGIFTSAPSVYATSSESQWQAWYANASSATSISVRCVTPVNASNSCTVSFYCVQS